jgi:hypothetical protein
MSGNFDLRSAIKQEQKIQFKEFNRKLTHDQALQNILPIVVDELQRLIAQQELRLRRLEKKRCVIS